MINYILLVSRQGKVRLTKWYTTLPNKTKSLIIRDITQLVLARKAKMCNILEYKGRKVVYKRYASLFFVAEIDSTDNELIALEVLHRFVEILDQDFGSVCELDLIFHFEQAYLILDELILGGELVDSSKSGMVKMLKIRRCVEAEITLTEGLKQAEMI